MEPRFRKRREKTAQHEPADSEQSAYISLNGLKQIFEAERQHLESLADTTRQDAPDHLTPLADQEAFKGQASAVDAASATYRRLAEGLAALIRH